MSRFDEVPPAATHEERQRAHSDAVFRSGSRSHVLSSDPLVRYVVRWRLLEAVKRLRSAGVTRPEPCSMLVLCAGEGLEGSILADAGFGQVTISDLSRRGVEAAVARDPRLHGSVMDAENTRLADNSYDVVLVQDGLHHLRRPVAGFTEMLRVARRGAFFLEPHDAWSGRRFGREWEQNGDATNYVFRWTRALVDQVANSYLGPDSFENLSFSFWHHNLQLERIGRLAGGGRRGCFAAATAKRLLDTVAFRSGNSFCGMVVKRREVSLLERTGTED